MKKIVLVVDGNFYLHRAFFTLRTSRPIEDVLPQNFTGLVMKDACAVKATHILVCFDGPAVFRYDIYEGYKAERRSKGIREDEDEGTKEIYAYLPAVRKYLEHSGVVWAQRKKYEADDLIVSSLFQYGDMPDVEVVAGTGDKDVFQGLRKKNRIYNSAVKPLPITITQKKAEKLKGIPIEGMVMYQTLLGDKIDSIPQILSPAKAKAAVLKWGTFKNWFTKGTKEDKRWLHANQVKLSLNRKLVEMVADLSLPEVDELKVPKLVLKDMPRAWYIYQDFLYPKSKGLFRR